MRAGRTTLGVAFLTCATLVHAGPPDKLIMVARAGQAGSLRLAYGTPSREALLAGAKTPDRFLVEVRYPSGAVAVATSTRIDGDAPRLVADGYGASPPRSGDPLSVSVVACRVDEKRTDCRCASFAGCRSRPVAGQDVKLVCRDGTRDDSCSARRRRCFTPDCILDDWNGDRERLVACGGDSNTYGSPAAPSWCPRLGEWLDDFTVKVFAWPWTRASDDPDKVAGFGVSSHPILNRMLRQRPVPDIVILAWGTNDVLAHSAEQTAEAIDVLVRWMRTAGVVPIVATIPWQFGVPPRVTASIDTVNATLTSRYRGCVIDFTTITPPTRSWYNDQRHLNDPAQERRAMEAYYALATLPRSCADGVAH